MHYEYWHEPMILIFENVGVERDYNRHIKIPL